MMIRAMEPVISTKLSYKRKTVKNVYFMESYVLQQNPFKLFTVSRGNPDFHLVEQSQTFTEIEDIGVAPNSTELELFQLNMLADRKNKYYTHEQASLLEFLGDIGGIQGIVFGVWFTFMMPIIAHSMNSQLVNEVYQVQQYSKVTKNLKIQSDKEKEQGKNPAKKDSLKSSFKDKKFSEDS